jgi:excinuclease ABC subunit C
MTTFIQQALKNLPQKPGVYIMKNNEDQVIYVGKAKDLSKRVSQYFLRPQAGKVQAMVMHIDHLETIITTTEKEALILEMNLIHRHYPRYNILLKEGGHYPYIALRKGPDPFLKIMRTNEDQRYKFFGPYPNAKSAYKIIDLLNKVFPLRKCNVLPKQACLYFHLGQCLAPCINKIEVDVYEGLSREIEYFLKGNTENKIKEFHAKMIEASDQLKFELAKEYKDTIDDIKHISDRQHVEIFDKKDRDIFAFSQREGYVVLTVFTFKEGLLIGKKSFVVESFGELEDQIYELITQYYSKQFLPDQMVINSKTIVTRLNELYGDVAIVASAGKLFEVVKAVQENSVQALDDHFLTARLDDDALALLDQLGQLLSLPAPLHIEMFDNSHLQGSSPVGAMVTFINGEPVKKLYRRFNIEHVQGKDDLASMREIVFRRYKRLKDEGGAFPNLIIVDGGKEQLKAGYDVLTELGLSIPIVGLFKNEKHATKGMLTIEGEALDLTKNPALFFFLVRMQDEVHRFAIAFHREQRRKKMTRSILDDVKGLGGVRKEMLQKAFATIDDLRKATLEELLQYLPEDVAQKLFEKLHASTKPVPKI